MVILESSAFRFFLRLSFNEIVSQGDVNIEIVYVFSQARVGSWE